MLGQMKGQATKRAWRLGLCKSEQARKGGEVRIGHCGGHS
jgi:hypothetical protein